MIINERNYLNRIKKLKKENKTLKDYVFENFLYSEGTFVWHYIMYADRAGAMAMFTKEGASEGYKKIYSILGKEYLSRTITHLIEEYGLQNLQKRLNKKGNN
jgi:hypothetical protein